MIRIPGLMEIRITPVTIQRLIYSQMLQDVTAPLLLISPLTILLHLQFLGQIPVSVMPMMDLSPSVDSMQIRSIHSAMIH